MSALNLAPAADLRPRGRSAFLALVCVALAGCGPSLSGLRQSGLPPRAAVAGVPLLEQREDHCGPASLAMLLGWSGVDTSPTQLAPRVFTPARRGTFALDLAREVRQQDRLAYRVRADAGALLTEVTAGHPVLILENRGLDVSPLWHFSVLAAFDLDRDRAVLHDGAAEPRVKSLTSLLRSWRRGGSFGLLALPPGRLPAAPDREGILRALVDLEEVGRAAVAVPGYEAYLRRWPEEWRAAFGLGNALHGLGRDELAESALRRAHATAPGRPEPLNNLAQLAWARGHAEEARALAAMALEAADALGMEAAPYAQTLQEVGGQVAPTEP